jgi:organic hydroperoxide reductase OsmC/OhrA
MEDDFYNDSNIKMAKQHIYKATISWTGNTGTGTSDYKSYERSHLIEIKGKPNIMASSDPSFRGDKSRHNPEDLFLSSVSTCHMLWYLHFCSDAKVVVTNYVDNPIGIMEETSNGGGRFVQVTLYPQVTVADVSMIDKANELHHKANEFCFIANSLNFEVKHEPLAKL